MLLSCMFLKKSSKDPELRGFFVFEKNISNNLHVHISSFYCAKLERILRADPELRRCIIF